MNISAKSKYIKDEALVNKLLEENNRKAYEMLLKIQSQLEASRVIATSMPSINFSTSIDSSISK